MSNFQYTRPDSFPPIVKNLIIINVIVYIAQLTMKQYDLTNLFALRPFNAGFEPYQIATHMFTHGSTFHIFFNMFALWMFGRILENVWGPKRFLLFYLICGVGAALFHLAIEYFTGGYSAAIGASGAIMGIFAAFAFLFPNTELYLMFIPVPVKAKWALIGMVALDLFGGVGMYSDGIAHFAHLGGALTGFILVLIYNKTGKKRFY
jgi:membrane associated rhomboid family serine protease